MTFKIHNTFNVPESEVAFLEFIFYSQSSYFRKMQKNFKMLNTIFTG